MKWLITGGCGFIGTRLIQRLVRNGGHQICVIDSLAVGSREDLASVAPFVEVDCSALKEASPFQKITEDHVGLIVGDIMNAELAIKVSHGADITMHLAANTGVGPSVDNPRMDCVTNVLGTLNYLEAARANGIKRFIFASSGAPVGECVPPIHEDIVPHPVSPYGASKLAGEAYCSAYFRTFGIETIALRFGNVYGPGSVHKSSVVAKFILRALHGQEIEIYGDGTNTRDFIYIDDLTQAISLAAEKPGVGGEVFQIATNAETAIAGLLESLKRAFDRHGLSCPKVFYSRPRLGDVQRNYSDTSKARRVLRWQAQMSLDDGLEKTLSWFIDRREAAS